MPLTSFIQQMWGFTIATGVLLIVLFIVLGGARPPNAFQMGVFDLRGAKLGISAESCVMRFVTKYGFGSADFCLSLLRSSHEEYSILAGESSSTRALQSEAMSISDFSNP